ncbi:MAG TPA: Ppx/GppA phosphatase family protein [Thermoleophilaceae bacterium]|nr:Ppx/GppA phosphatase family protein [Thermoleophilaceae bacterium]
MERTAVIDMGSNSFRLVVFQHEPGSWWSLADEIREPVRISAGMGEDGVLQPAPVERAIATAAVFSSFLEASGVERVDAVATSAIRDARNRDELLAEIRASTGLEVRVISGAEEAWYGYLAVVNSTTLADGFGIDVGGGSVQVMRIADRRLVEAESVRLGAVRMSEAFLPGERAKPKQLQAVRDHVSRTLSEFEWWQGEGAGGSRPRTPEAPGRSQAGSDRLAAIGGTVRNLATAVQKRMDLPDVDEQGFVVTREALEDLIELLASRPASERGTVPGIKPDRGDVILGGALVVAAAMEHGGFTELEVAEAGLREGVFFEHLLADRTPPLLDDVRRSSVENLAHRFRTDPVHVEHVARLSLETFDSLRSAGLHDLGDNDRELLWAGGMLHDIGMTVDYDDHHRHSHYLIVHTGLPGFSPREVDLIALIARYHRKGTPDAAELGALQRPGDSERLRLLSAIIRLAEQLERSRDQTIASVRVQATDGKVTLEAVARDGSDPTVAIWAGQRGSTLLADTLGAPVSIVPSSPRA